VTVTAASTAAADLSTLTAGDLDTGISPLCRRRYRISGGERPALPENDRADRS
jgi:hypothetical protein